MEFNNSHYVRKTSIHEIRRTVSSYLRQELPIKAVASMLGHLEVTNELCYNYDMSETLEKTRALEELSSKIIKFQANEQTQKRREAHDYRASRTLHLVARGGFHPFTKS